MRMLTRCFILLAVFATPLTSQAQVANGDFAGGTASWTWRAAVFNSVLSGPTCSTAAYTTFSASTANDTPWSGSAPASGRVALMNDYMPYGSGRWLVCRRIEQMVFVPAGKSLKFDVRIGAELNYTVPWTFGNMTVAIAAFDPTTGSDITLYAETRKTSRCVVNSTCPVFVSRTIGVSQYAGRTIRLTVSGATSGANNTSGLMTMEPTPAWIDNIRFE